MSTPGERLAARREAKAAGRVRYYERIAEEKRQKLVDAKRELKQLQHTPGVGAAELGLLFARLWRWVSRRLSKRLRDADAAYQVEQHLTPVEDRRCTRCRGAGCRECVLAGSQEGAASHIVQLRHARRKVTRATTGHSEALIVRDTMRLADGTNKTFDAIRNIDPDEYNRIKMVLDKKAHESGNC